MTEPTVTGPIHRPARVRFARGFCATAIRALFRLRIEGREHLAKGPAIYCFNHLNWTDPIVLIAALPGVPKYALFGPREADMTKGARNRLISWVGFGIPFQPAKTDLLEMTRRTCRVIEDGWIVVISGEGRIHRGERELMPLADGPAYFSLRAHVPIVPVAINGTSWLGFRRIIRVRVGESLTGEGRPTKEAVATLTGRTADALRALVADFPDPAEPGRFGRWLTELFNDWPEGARPALGEGDAAILARAGAGAGAQPGADRGAEPG